MFLYKIPSKQYRIWINLSINELVGSTFHLVLFASALSEWEDRESDRQTKFTENC